MDISSSILRKIVYSCNDCQIVVCCINDIKRLHQIHKIGSLKKQCQIMTAFNVFVMMKIKQTDCFKLLHAVQVLIWTKGPKLLGGVLCPL